MEALGYEPKLDRKLMPVLGDLELELSKLEDVENPNVRRVAITARNTRERLEADPSYEIQGTYSEAYQGEIA